MRRILALALGLCLGTGCLASSAVVAVYETVTTETDYEQQVLAPALRIAPRSGELLEERDWSLELAGASSPARHHGAELGGTTMALQGASAAASVGLPSKMEIGILGQLDLPYRRGGRRLSSLDPMMQPLVGFGSSFRAGTSWSEQTRGGLMLWTTVHGAPRRLSGDQTSITVTDYSDGSSRSDTELDSFSTTTQVLWVQGGGGGWIEHDMAPLWTVRGGLSAQFYPGTWGTYEARQVCRDDLTDSEEGTCSGSNAAPGALTPRAALTPEASLRFEPIEQIALSGRFWGHLGGEALRRSAPVGGLLSLEFSPR